jgi:hypothetical protein
VGWLMSDGWSVMANFFHGELPGLLVLGSSLLILLCSLLWSFCINLSRGLLDFGGCVYSIYMYAFP